MGKKQRKRKADRDEVFGIEGIPKLQKSHGTSSPNAVLNIQRKAPLTLNGDSPSRSFGFQTRNAEIESNECGKNNGNAVIPSNPPSELALQSSQLKNEMEIPKKSPVIKSDNNPNVVEKHVQVCDEINSRLGEIANLRSQLETFEQERLSLEKQIQGESCLDNSWSIEAQLEYISKHKTDHNKEVFIFISNLLTELAKSNMKSKKAVEEVVLVTSSSKLNAEKSLQLVTCSICMDIYCNPFTVECGHTFCYFCIQGWIKRLDYNGNCPSCRKKLLAKPFPAITIQSHVDHVISNLSPEKREAFSEKVSTERESFNKVHDPWKTWIKAETHMIDDVGDAVGRYLQNLSIFTNTYSCIQCGWEIIDFHCSHCGSYYPEHEDRGENVDYSGSDNDQGEDIRFSGSDNGESQFDSDEERLHQEGFIVDDDQVEYESGSDGLSDAEHMNQEETEDELPPKEKVRKSAVIEESDSD